MKVGDNNPSAAVERTLAILEALSQREAGLTNAQISRSLGIPKSSASYILRTLERRGYLRRDRETGRYRLGLKVLSLRRGVVIGREIREAALPFLRQLVERSRLTAHLAVLDHNEAVYIAREEGPGFIKMNTWVGRRMEVHSTSVGKALAAHLPEVEVETVLKDRGLKKFTPKTITSHARFLQELRKVREQEYALDDEENNLGVRCVAAPIFGAPGHVEASVGVSGTTSQVDRDNLSKIVELVKDAARKISRQLRSQSALR